MLNKSEFKIITKERGQVVDAPCQPDRRSSLLNQGLTASLWSLVINLRMRLGGSASPGSASRMLRFDRLAP
jgi:hypothetical protein